MYNPWVILVWIKFSEYLSLSRLTFKKLSIYFIALIILTWSEFNSGAPKEMLVSAILVQCFGLVIFYINISKKFGFKKSLFFIILYSLSILMILSPYWLIFYDALQKSFTNYDTPGVETYNINKIILYFENFYSVNKNGALNLSLIHI